MSLALQTTVQGIRRAKDWLGGHRMVLLGFAVSTAYVPTILQAAFAPRWIAIAIGVPLVSTMDPRNIPESLRWVLLFLLGVAAIATTWASPDPMGGYLELFFMVLLALSFLAGAGMASIDDVMTGIGLGLTVSALITLFEFSTPSDQGRDEMTGAAPTALFYNSEVYAEFAALVFVWAIARVRLTIAAVTLLPLMLCNSRIAILTAAIGALYTYGPKSKIKMAGAILGLAALAAALLFVFGISKMGSADQRLILWGSTILAWTQFGHGLGWYNVAQPGLEFAHSDAIQLIAELGIGGFAALAIPFVVFRKQRGNHAERALFIAICFQSIVSFPLHFPASGFLAAIVAGYLVSNRADLRMGELDGGIQDGGGLRRLDATDQGFAGAGGRRGGAIPIRPVLAQGKKLRSPKDWRHPEPRGA
jgi:hypothetical protein